MKTTLKFFLIAVVLGIFLAGSSMAQKSRKLPAGAYIKTAKIHILSGDPERYEQAILMLDSLFINYGPHAEGLFWMSQIYVDYIDKTPDMAGKKKFVEKMVAYNDSLAICCDKDNKEVDEKFKKDCNKFTEKVDSTATLYWRQFYNEGIGQLNEIKLIISDMATETDSASLAFYQEKLSKFSDSCTNSIALALVIDSSNYLTYVVLGTLNEQIKDYEKSNLWLEKGLEHTDIPEERNPLLVQIAYNYINMKNFCDAIPYFREYINNVPDDIPNARNLSVCYNKCEMFDSAYTLNKKLLEKNPDNFDVLNSIGGYWNQMGRSATDSTNKCRASKNDACIKEMQDKTKLYFDSSRVYYKKVFSLKPDDEVAAEEYAVIAAILGNYEEAVVPFIRLTELVPTKSLYWTYLGDCYLNLKKFKESADSYEKVIELEPDDKEILERLVNLYSELKLNDKLKIAQDKLKALE